MNRLIRRKFAAWYGECASTQSLPGTHLLLAATLLAAVVVLIVQAAIWIVSA